MSHMIHIAAATQIRLDTPSRAYYRRKLAAGKTRAEAMRCLKRRISDAIFRQLLTDARRAALIHAPDASDADPGGHCVASQNSARSTCPRSSILRISHFPDPRTRRYNPPSEPRRPRPESPSRPPVDNRGEPV